ncbi:MAG: TolC family protein [Bacteroidales bacterium]|nr:TolC family protein [Bacteroidales bacterium]
MKVIRTIMLCIVVFIHCEQKIYAQGTLEITVEQAEKQFLEQNLLLLAERCNIGIADAAIVQAKVLNNPTIGVSDINFWHPNAAEEIELSRNSFGNRIVFSVELEQIIRTAGKRRKLIDLEKVSKEISVQEFEAFLLSLKTELRTLLYETIYLQSYLDVVSIQKDAISSLVEIYKTQTSAGNIAKSELIRLQSSLIELETEYNELLTELHGVCKELKILLNISPETGILILNSTSVAKNPEDISVVQLIEMAKNSRPEFLLSDLNIKYSEKLLRYEKSLRAPDIALSANYDRYGGVWKNFVGLGISVEIPAFNRNQGNIKIAKLNIEQNNYYAEYQKNVILHEIAENFEHYTLKYNYYKKLMDNDFSADLEEMLGVYSRNLLNRNINMLEYIDFMDAYKTTKQAILTAKKNMELNFVELQYSVNGSIN